MSLLNTYKEKNKNPEWFHDHFSLGKKAKGVMFEYVNTNFRKQDSFIDQFEKFLEIEGKSRDSWVHQESHQQERDKHRVINMLQSKLFRKDNNNLYTRTSKGLLYSDFISKKFEGPNMWLINYLFLLNGYYLNQKNYILYRVKEQLLGFLLSVEGLDVDKIIQYTKEILSSESLREDLRNTFFYIHSFYDDSDFLISYLRSTREEKEELAQYIEDNLASRNYICCISKKYQNGGNFNHGMLIDEAKTFLITLLFLNSKDPSVKNLYEIFVGNFHSHVQNIDKDLVVNYLRENHNVFDPIFSEVLSLEDREISEIEEIDSLNISEVSVVEITDRAEEYIDETSDIGKQQIKAIFSIRKKQARIQSNYCCALEIINNCKPIYFTSKSNGKNYLELHHLIPREFRNDFSHSIEVLANYVTLCPRCHRQIHLAVDRERKHLINTLYEDRKERLKIVGLEIERKILFDYYKIDY